MRVPRIHLAVPLAVGMTVPLAGKAFQHAIQVLRLKPGARLILFNGEGGEFHTRLIAVERRSATVRIEAFAPREVEAPFDVLLAQGIAKGDRMDYTLQKAVELGVTTILPLLTERSVFSLQGQRLENRLLHWSGVVTGACEQCGRNRIPSVLKPQHLDTWLANHGNRGLSLLLDPAAKQGLNQLPRPHQAITLLIGPEGGLSPAEVALTKSAGFIGIRLGPRVMRTETAGVAALAALQTLWGDLG